MKSPKSFKDNEISIFYPEKKDFKLKDMTTQLSYELDAIPDDRNSYHTTKYLNKLQKGEVDDSAKWSVADRTLALLLYGMQQNKDVKAKFNYSEPCRFCGIKHSFVYNYASLVNFKGSGIYKPPPKEWPVEKWGEKEIKLRPMTGEFETLIEFHESRYRKERLNPHKKDTIEHVNFNSEVAEHNSVVFFEVQLFKVSAHTGVDVEELKEMPVEKFVDLLEIIQKHEKDLNYGVQFWKDEDQQLANPGLIEYYHTCTEPNEEYMEKNDPELLKQYKEGGLEAILITLPFRSEYCT